MREDPIQSYPNNIVFQVDQFGHMYTQGSLVAGNDTFTVEQGLVTVENAKILGRLVGIFVKII